MSPKKLYIKTYGCQMNVYDSMRMGDLMKPFGFEPSESADGADMVILNTCHIREKAADRMYSELGRLREQKEEKDGKMIITVAGCVGQAEGEEIFRRAPYVDIVTGPQSYQSLPELLTKVMRDGGHALDLDFPPVSKFDTLPEDASPQGVSAFLSVQEGCDKFCTFCVVPYTRGAEYSRPVSDIYREAVRMAAQGSIEITLLGQNVNAYHGTGPEGQSWTLGQLINHIAQIDGIKRIRYTTSHPRDMDDALIEAHGSIDKLMPFLHLPVQSGSNNILSAMNRKHTAEEYLRIIERLRGARPDIGFSSDFIVGFPGETDKDFEDTVALVKEVGFGQAYSFKYSPRPGTPASVKDNHVPDEVMTERLTRLQQVIEEQQFLYNQRTVGKTIDVLFDRQGKREGQLVGRSPYMQSVLLNAPLSLQGSILPVRIEAAYAHSVLATLTTHVKDAA